jgi:DNA-binding winged helix-turn-helix (wHTH) protein
MPEPQRFVFGSFQLDLRDERLWCGPEVVRLPPKAFAVLSCLVTQAGQLVTKDALLAAVWPDTVVSEDVITVAMRQLPRVLGDQTHTPRFIETVHGRGYRFIAPLLGRSRLHCVLDHAHRGPRRRVYDPGASVLHLPDSPRVARHYLRLDRRLDEDRKRHRTGPQAPGSRAIAPQQAERGVSLWMG